MLSFYKQQSYFSQIVSKKAKITIYFFYEKFQKITILFWVLVFSFMYLVSVYPTNRIYIYSKKFSKFASPKEVLLVSKINFPPLNNLSERAEEAFDGMFCKRKIRYLIDLSSTANLDLL